MTRAAPIRPVIPGLALGDALGGGGFGAVWAARLPDGTRAAVKTAHGRTRDAAARLDREARALARIGPPHVPAVLGQGVAEDGRPYLVLERIEGGTLAERLERAAAPLSPARACAIADAILASLEAVHAAGLVHCDLKPGNVLFRSPPAGSPGTRVAGAADADASVCLIDLGIAVAGDGGGGDRDGADGEGAGAGGPPGDERAAGDPDGADGGIAGTAEYNAPEQLDSSARARGTLDARADLYSLGVLLYELLTLRVPFTGDRPTIERGHRELRPARPGAFAPIPEPLERLCLACLAKRPEERPESAAALRAALSRAGRGERQADPRGQQARTLLGDSRMPVLIAVCDLPSLERAARPVIEQRSGVIVHERGPRTVFAFPRGHRRLASALATAHALHDERAARVALHLAELRIRRRGDSGELRLYGAEVDRPEMWLPPGAWGGVVVTDGVAEMVRPARVRPHARWNGFHELLADASPAAGPPLVGRDNTVAALLAGARAAFANRTPGLATMIGEHGRGKTRLCAELAARVGDEQGPVLVISTRAERRTLGGEGLLARMCEQFADSPPPAAAPDAPPADSRGGAVEPEAAELAAADAMVALGNRIRATARDHPVVLIVDDAHDAEDALLDAIEYATLDGAGVALWVVVAADPRLERRRPRWGASAYRHDRVVLPPLSGDAAAALARELLRPAEYIPRALLDQLGQWTGGNPRTLVELVRTLVREGLIQTGNGATGARAATARLSQLSASPVEQWMAHRQLRALPEEWAALARLCSVLGPAFSRAEVEWVQNTAERTGAASTSIDAGVGLRELARLGLIRATGGDDWAFEQPALQDAVYRLLADRDRVAHHAAALAFWTAQDDAEAAGEPAARSHRRAHRLAVIARHADASGQRDQAADGYLALADDARARHRDVEADQRYEQALRLVAATDAARRVRALAGRGKARYRMQRCDDAIQDLQAARGYAAMLDDPGLIANLWLEEAVAHDWARAFEDAARCVDTAAPLVERAGDPALATRLAVRQARIAWVNSDTPRAIALSERAAGEAAARGDDETRVLALLALAHSLVLARRYDEAEARFDEVIALSRAAGDGLHLGAAYSNRIGLWAARKQIDRVLSDLRRTIKLARELGQPTLEYAATYNLAEYLHWSGDRDEALRLAARALELQDRFIPGPVPDSVLLLARLHCARRAWDEARAMLARVDELAARRELLPSNQAMRRMVELRLLAADGVQSPPRAWDEVTRERRDLAMGEELLELHYFQIHAALDGDNRREARRALAVASDMLPEHPLWSREFGELEHLIAERDEASG